MERDKAGNDRQAVGAPASGSVTASQAPGVLRQRSPNERLLLALGWRQCRFTSVAFSKDGRWLAAGATDGLVYVLNTQTLELLRWLEGHTGAVNSVAFSPDGTRLASGSDDRTVLLWDAASGAALQRLEGHRGTVTSVAFSPDGVWLASGSDDRTVLLWDAASGAALQRLEGHRGTVTSVAFSPDGVWLASGSDDYTVRLWDAASGAALQRLEGHKGPVTSVAFSPDGAWLASGSTDRTVRVWGEASNEKSMLLMLNRHENSVTSVAFSPDGTRLASGSKDWTVRQWDFKSGVLLRFEGHGGTVTSVAYKPDGVRLVSGSWDNMIRMWDVSSGAELQQIKGREHQVMSLAYSPDGVWLASGSWDNAVRIWGASSGAELQQCEGHVYWVASVAYSPDSAQLASGSNDKTIWLWDAASGAVLQRLEGHEGPITCVTYSPDGARLASGSNDYTVRLWDTTSGAALYRLYGHHGAVLCVAYSPDGARLASGSADNIVMLWDAASGAALHRLERCEGAVTSVAFSPDGIWLASGSNNNMVLLWDVANGKMLKMLEGHTGSIISLAFTFDGKWLLSLAQDRTVRMWRMADGASTIVAKISAPWHYASLALAFVPAGSYSLNFDDAILIEEIRCDPAAVFRNAGQNVCLSSVKVVLLGDSGVGKSTLVRRIQTGQFQPQDSTHGMELLTLDPELLAPSAAAPAGERREVVLWDLGGQEEYRLVHQLFLHDTQLALLLCDTTRGQKEYAMVREWNALLEKQRGGVPTIKLLVGSKVDDSAAIMDQVAIKDTETACGTRPFISVSANTGHGIDELKRALAEAIDWDEITKTSRPALFQRIRDRIDTARDQGIVSLSLIELREQVRAAVPEEYDEAALSLVVGQLSRQGVIVDTCRANGERELVLKLAEIERYAGSLILMAKLARQQTGMGVPAFEATALQAEGLLFSRIAAKDRLPRVQERIVLECVVQLLIERGLCLAHQGLLVFPSLYPQGECRPIDGTDSVSLYYDFTGPSDALYAQLAARAAMSARFGRVRLSAGRAEFGQRDADGMCGVQYQARGQGRGHIDIYFCPETPVATRQLFRAFVEDFLKEHGVDVREVVELRCQECQHVFPETDVRGRIETGKAAIFCPDGHPTPIDAAFKDARESSPDLAGRLAALKTVMDRNTESAANSASRAISAAPASTSTTGTATSVARQPLRLLHLSDLHFSASTDPVQMLQPLVADLTDRQGLKLDKLDYLVVSGDCTCIGSAEEFEQVHKFLGLLIDRFGLSAQRCVLVPGNHDLSWKEKVYEWLDASEVGTDKPSADRYIKQGDGYLVRSDDAIYCQRFKNFSTFHHEFMQHPYPLEMEQQAQVYIHADDKIQFIGLNSSCRIDRYFRERACIDGRALSHALIEAEKQIKDAVTGGRIVASDNVLRIAVWHHPITGNEKIFDDAFVQRLQQADVQLCLHGHIHENRADLIGHTHPTRHLHTIGAGSFGAMALDRPESTPRLYNLIEIAADHSKVRVHTRQMQKAGGAWKAHADWPGEQDIIRSYYDIKLKKD